MTSYYSPVASMGQAFTDFAPRRMALESVSTTVKGPGVRPL
jgi:hypothetical protein